MLVNCLNFKHPIKKNLNFDGDYFNYFFSKMLSNDRFCSIKYETVCCNCSISVLILLVKEGSVVLDSLIFLFKIL